MVAQLRRIIQSEIDLFAYKDINLFSFEFQYMSYIDFLFYIKQLTKTLADIDKTINNSMSTGSNSHNLSKAQNRFVPPGTNKFLNNFS